MGLTLYNITTYPYIAMTCNCHCVSLQNQLREVTEMKLKQTLPMSKSVLVEMTNEEYSAFLQLLRVRDNLATNKEVSK